MKRHGPALALVGDLDLEAEDVAELALERVEVGIDRLGRVARACAADVDARARARLLAPRPAPRPGGPTGPWR